MDDWEDFLSVPFRDRSNTWPRCVDTKPEGSPPPTVPDIIEEPSDVQEVETVSVPRKNPRRNVWGNRSYAELITEAILSTHEKRMTLSQIYNWMANNVDCFRNKETDNSSAGWKNSIRHNLSLHDCFMKLPNEQAGQSSWWVLNPSAKSSKLPRRRLSNNPIKDVDQPDEPFRRRTRSDCSSHMKRRISPPSSNSYSPSCSNISHTLELQKQEASEILDSLIEAMKLKADVSLSFMSPESTEPFSNPSCNSAIINQEPDIFVSSVTDALKIEREDNKYLEAVEPISASPPKFSDHFVPSLASGYSAQVLPSYSDNIFKPSESKYSVNTERSTPWDSYLETTQNISLFNDCISNTQRYFQPINLNSKEEKGVFEASGKQNQFQIKESEYARNWSDDPTIDFSGVLQFSNPKHRKSEDSSGRPRSKSYSGRPNVKNPSRETAQVTLCQDTLYLDLEDWLRDNYKELTLQDLNF